MAQHTELLVKTVDASSLSAVDKDICDTPHWRRHVLKASARSCGVYASGETYVELVWTLAFETLLTEKNMHCLKTSNVLLSSGRRSLIYEITVLIPAENIRLFESNPIFVLTGFTRSNTVYTHSPMDIEMTSLHGRQVCIVLVITEYKQIDYSICTKLN